MADCFFIKPVQVNAPVFVILGRTGDIIQLLPAFKAIHDRTKYKPVIIASEEYAGVLDGVSYCQPVALKVEWWNGVPEAKKLADEKYGGGCIVQWWSDKDTIINNPNGVILQSHGREWGVDSNKWPDYGTSMWDRAGFNRLEMMTLPLVFDRRDLKREADLIDSLRLKPDKKILLVNFEGKSSPFALMPEVMRIIQNFANKFQVVNLGKITGHRIYDLLGLMDRADGMVTIDTATLHLAIGSKIPYAAYVVNGWSQSVPKGNCQLKTMYSETLKRLAELENWLSKL